MPIKFAQAVLTAALLLCTAVETTDGFAPSSSFATITTARKTTHVVPVVPPLWQQAIQEDEENTFHGSAGSTLLSPAPAPAPPTSSNPTPRRPINQLVSDDTFVLPQPQVLLQELPPPQQLAPPQQPNHTLQTDFIPSMAAQAAAFGRQWGVTEDDNNKRQADNETYSVPFIPNMQEEAAALAQKWGIGTTTTTTTTAQPKTEVTVSAAATSTGTSEAATSETMKKSSSSYNVADAIEADEATAEKLRALYDEYLKKIKNEGAAATAGRPLFRVPPANNPRRPSSSSSSPVKTTKTTVTTIPTTTTTTATTTNSSSTNTTVNPTDAPAEEYSPESGNDPKGKLSNE
eukprot:scaffold1475_cov167-Amphora_coffeaeformis.AAC.7